MVNRPFTTSKNFHFQSEAKCKTSLVKRNFICMGMKHHLQINCFALRLALKQRRQATFAKSSNSSFARGYTYLGVMLQQKLAKSTSYP